jgi:uncharacterized protein
VIRSFELDSAHNKISALMVTPDAGKGPYPAVILSHGLISSKTSSKYVTLSDRLAAMGIASCRFDYHGCGESGGDIRETTLTIRLENLDCVVENVMSRQDIDPDRIGILGSSFGGVTCLIKASRDPRIKCVSPWATPYLLEKNDDDEIDDIVFGDELYADFARYDILSSGENVSHALVVHGDADKVVPCHEGKRIYERLRQPKRLEVIEGADHILSNPVHRERAISLALEWFGTYLLS